MLICTLQVMKNFEPSIIGRSYDAGGPFHVTIERIRTFCEAIGETNPLYIDPETAKSGPYGTIVAPPSFVASFRYAENIFDQMPQFDRGGLMAGIDIELEAPLKAGDEIRVTSAVKEMFEKTGRSGTMAFIVVRSTLTNQRGEIVARVDHRMMRRT